MSAEPVRAPGRPVGGVLVADRELVLANAEKVIRRDGANASIDAIARESGVTKPTVYARVGGRTELSNALAERLTERLVATAAAAMAEAGDGRSSLANLIRVTLETLDHDRELFLYVTGGDTADDRVHLAARISGPLGEQLQRWRGDADLDPAVSETWGYAVVGMLNLVSLWWIDQPDRTAEAVAEQVTDLLWSGLSGA